MLSVRQSRFGLEYLSRLKKKDTFLLIQKQEGKDVSMKDEIARLEDNEMDTR